MRTAYSSTEVLIMISLSSYSNRGTSGLAYCRLNVTKTAKFSTDGLARLQSHIEVQASASFSPAHGDNGQCITLYYKGARDRLAAEVFHFGSDEKVTSAFAHYGE